MKALIIVIMILPFLIVLSLLTDGKRPETGKTPEYVIGFVEMVTEDSGKSQINQHWCVEYVMSIRISC